MLFNHLVSAWHHNRPATNRGDRDNPQSRMSCGSHAHYDAAGWTQKDENVSVEPGHENTRLKYFNHYLVYIRCYDSGIKNNGKMALMVYL